MRGAHGKLGRARSSSEPIQLHLHGRRGPLGPSKPIRANRSPHGPTIEAHSCTPHKHLVRSQPCRLVRGISFVAHSRTHIHLVGPHSRARAIARPQPHIGRSRAVVHTRAHHTPLARAHHATPTSMHAWPRLPPARSPRMHIGRRRQITSALPAWHGMASNIVKECMEGGAA